MQQQLSQINQNIKNININNINNQELKFDNGKFIGQVVNGKAEGKGIWYGYSGDRYEGEWRNNKMEGKGIYYYNNAPWKGDRL